MADWASVRWLARHLAADQIPRLPPRFDIILPRGDTLLADGPAHYARFYATDASYTHTDGFYWGSVGFMAVGYGVNALVNNSRKKQAQAAAAPQWRDQMTARVAVTDKRLVTYLPDGRTLNFDYDAVNELHPNIPAEAVVLGFEGPAGHLSLQGPVAPFAALTALWYVHGADALRYHDQVRPLLVDQPPAVTS